ncbi:MAG: T9SS type A sorting domain-containing protein [Ignavibacteria bacterium]
MKSIFTLCLTLFLSINLFGQLSPEYQSQYYQYYSTAGWFPFKKNGTNWEYRFYYVDSTKFQIFSSVYNGSVQYQYNFAQPEVTAGGIIYSFGIDLTGDNIVEFYVIGKYTNASYTRQSIKILNIVNNTTILELNSPNYYYSTPLIYDIDNDGILEMIFIEYDINNNWRYRLIVYNTNVSTGTSEDNSIIGFDLKQNYPNPFNPGTTIEFKIPVQSNVKLEIINLNGQLIKTLINNELQPGIYKFDWNGTDNFNNRVSSGVYIYRLIQNENELSRKMILLK